MNISILSSGNRVRFKGDEMTETQPWPVEIRLKRDRKTLAIQFDDGVTHELPAELLRVLSPSAEVQGHSPEQRKTIGGKKDIAIAAVDRVGNYAVRITFDDRHDTGIYAWSYLRRLGDQRENLWTAYLAELEAKGLRREAQA
jgi:DUF971 family protein